MRSHAVRQLAPFVLLFLVFTVIFATRPLVAGAAPVFLTTQGSKFMYQGQTVLLRGENFNNEPANSCCGGPDINLINAGQSDYAQIHTLGANHIRFGMDYAWYSSNKTQFFSVLDQHVAWAAQYQLWVYFVLYMVPGGASGGYDQSHANGYCIWSDCPTASTNQNLMNTFWSDMATHFASNPNVLGYDLFNEPAPPSLSEWVSFGSRLYNTVTAVDHNHIVIIEDTGGSDLSGFTQTTQVAYSVHHYAGGDNLPSGEPANTPLIIGEFGGLRTDSTAVSFTSTEISRYNSLGISWSHFVMREDAAGFRLPRLGRPWRGDQ